MTNPRVLILAFVMVVSANPVAAQGGFHYREYRLGTSLASVIAISDGREADSKTIHIRPARIQTFEWRAPYMLRTGIAADPVRDVLFSFYDDQLYRVVVNYDRARTDGLTNEDVIAALSAIYGAPVRPATGTPRESLPASLRSDTIIVAQWEDASSLVLLTRSTLPLFQLSLMSKATSGLASAAIAEALRLDALEAPQRELDRRHKATADAAGAAANTRETNKGAFRP